jgi:UDP-N-acetylmuramyl pentapeptide phosphotransferase/UDP-N-acetylglucosamine-1-phosphate transferase
MGLAGLLYVLSIADDWRGLPASLRFGGHFAVATGLALWVAGASPLALAGAIAMTWMTNLYNFMDGANGLAGGMTVIGFGVLGPGFGRSHSGLRGCRRGARLPVLQLRSGARVSWRCRLGAARLSRRRAVFCRRGARALAAWFPLLVFAPFVADATVTLLKRMARREKVWAAHRQHYYQRLVRMGGRTAAWRWRNMP